MKEFMEPLQQEIDLLLHSVRLRFVTSDTDLLRFVHNFTGLCAERKGEEPHITVACSGDSPAVNLQGMHQVSRTLWIGDGKMYLSAIDRFPGLRLTAALSGTTLRVQASCTGIGGAASRIKQLSRRFRRRRLRLYAGIVYYLVYFPFFYYIEHCSGMHLLHAGAVLWEEKGVVLTGLGGIGKSSLTLQAACCDKGRYISDNLLLHDRHAVHTVPEPFALDLSRWHGAAAVDEVLMPLRIESTHGREFYRLKRDCRVDTAIPAAVFWLQWGDEITVTPIDSAACARIVCQINLLANELREYYLLSANMDLAFQEPVTPAQYFEGMVALLAPAQCYCLTIQPGVPLETVLEKTIARVLP